MSLKTPPPVSGDAPSADVPLVPAPAEPAPAERSVVLCIDDEPLVLSSLRRALDGEFTVRLLNAETAAVTIVQARAAIAALPQKAVVITDLRMPGMDGAEVIKVARELRHPVVVVSGTTGDLGLEDKPDAVITKPFDLQTLRATVRRLLKAPSGETVKE